MLNDVTKIVVTGGAGFIGSHIVNALVDEGYQVHVIDNLYSGKKENVNPKAIFHNVDVRDYNKLLPIFKDVKYVFHEAALPQVQYSIEHPIEANEVNVLGTLNILEVSRINKVKRVIYASSSAIYGDQKTLPITENMPVNPFSPYGAQKYIGEVYMKLYSEIYNLETICLRYFNVYGPRQSASGAYASVIPKFIEFRKNKKPLLITGDGEQTRDFVNVKDIINANILAMKSKEVGKGEVINIGASKPYSINNIAKLIGGEVSFIPARIEPQKTQASILKAKQLLNWEPIITFEDGLLELKKYNNI